MHNAKYRTPTEESLPASLKGPFLERQDSIRKGIELMIAEHRRGNFAEDGTINIGRLTANLGFQVYDREVVPMLAEIRAETAKVCSPS
ncbi:hypothetical protein [Variovorax sp. GB1P17]|uniref:hypothetical protein n=1 Tax=Variovorax sp. GB1P17 TaxID=3443740 RepID=UPI003F48DA12